jgi:ubiquinone/menaquinone biosynthesis C-methylase UbiE
MCRKSLISRELTDIKNSLYQVFMKRSLDIFRALADPTRLRIIALIRRMELAVGEVAQVLGQSQPRVSRHIRILCEAGLAQRRKEGSWVFLELGPTAVVQPVLQAIDHWSEGGANDVWAVADVARLAAVRADRAAAAERYFAAHADQWDSLRSLHAADHDVETAMVAALGDHGVGRLVDVGTGTGRMIALFGPKAQKSVGIDRSPEMLRLARGKLSQIEGLECDLRKGDVTALPLDTGAADTVILHQVLHFLFDPGPAIAEIGRVLSEKGRVLIVDFASHDREELRTQDAHARLGFSDEQIAGWMAATGLTLDHVDEVKGGALTVKLWRGEKQAARRLAAVAA